MRAARPDSARCRAQRRDGTACQAKAGPSGYCIGHQPGAADAHRKGGAATSSANRAAKLMPSALKPYVGKLGAIFDEVYEQRAQPDEVRAHTLQQAASVMARVGAMVGRLIAIGEFEERLRALEQAAAREQIERQREGGKALL